ncbi:hypothetical protein [Thermogemmatispora sp.]
MLLIGGGTAAHFHASEPL